MKTSLGELSKGCTEQTRLWQLKSLSRALSGNFTKKKASITVQKYIYERLFNGASMFTYTSTRYFLIGLAITTHFIHASQNKVSIYASLIKDCNAKVFSDQQQTNNQNGNVWLAFSQNDAYRFECSKGKQCMDIAMRQFIFGGAVLGGILGMLTYPECLQTAPFRTSGLAVLWVLCGGFFINQTWRYANITKAEAVLKDFAQTKTPSWMSSGSPALCDNNPYVLASRTNYTQLIQSLRTHGITIHRVEE